MSDAPLDREMLIEIVTREVLTTLAERSDICASPEKLRAVLANGADRVAYHGDASSVPVELAWSQTTAPGAARPNRRHYVTHGSSDPGHSERAHPQVPAGRACFDSHVGPG